MSDADDQQAPAAQPAPQPAADDQADGVPEPVTESPEESQPEALSPPETAPGVEEAADHIKASLVTLGFINFDASSASNVTADIMVSEEKRAHFRRDVYVGIKDSEQGKEFLGRIVEGPFSSPHEISADSAISRVTMLHPERTKFRPTYYVHGSIEILGEVVGEEQLLPTPTRPRPYSETYIFPAERLRKMLGLEGPMLIGHLMGYESVTVNADIEDKNLLPRNVGVFGTIGAGKSNTTQMLMEEATEAGWAVVVVDVEGEYVRMGEPTDDGRLIGILKSFGLEPAGCPDFRVFVPSAGRSDAANPQRFKVPVSEVDTGIIAEILELSEPQVRMLDRITSAARRAPQRGGGGRLGALGGGAAAGTAAAPYTLQTLIDGLDEAGGFPLVQAPPPTPVELSTCHALRSKLIGLGRANMLDWNATNQIAQLPIDDLLVGGRLSVLDVSETDDRSRNIAIAYLLQALFDRVLTADVGERLPSGTIRPRVLVVIEEVHTFVSRASAAKMKSVIDQLQIISRRGRKRWMGLVLVSQQPGHVPDEMFELANTRFIHQLKSSANLAPVRQTTGGVHEALWDTVPALGPGQCLLTGAVFRNPVFVTVRPAKSRRLLTT